jgi:RNA-directed DNA polymerase
MSGDVHVRFCESGRGRFPPATHLVILSCGFAAEALGWTRGVLAKLGLTLNEEKTSVRDARKERFDFLGYTFGPQVHPRTGRVYLGAGPSAKSVHRVKGKVNALLHTGNRDAWEEVRDQLNSLLLGWRGYFNYGTKARAHQGVDNHTFTRVKRFLTRRQSVLPDGTRRFSGGAVYGDLGVVRLRPGSRGATSIAVR